MAPGAIRATARGFNEMRERVPVLARIHVAYALTVPRGSRETVERSLARHVERCPTAMSLAGAVTVTWEAEVREGEDRWSMEAGQVMG